MAKGRAGLPDAPPSSQIGMAQFTASGFASITFVALPAREISIRRGFIASGTSRTRSM